MSAYRYLFFIFLLTTILIDSVSKKWFWLSRPDLYPGHYGKIIYFEAHQNYGLMLGLGADFDSNMRLFIGVILVGLLLGCLLLALLYKGFTSPATCLAWGFLLGGGISNLIERYQTGAVSDFIIIDYAGFQSGIFNPADLANLTGLIILICTIIFRGKFN